MQEPSTFSWANSRRNVEADDDLRMCVPRQWFIANRSSHHCGKTRRGLLGHFE
jgi:hypothetical protein